MVNFSLAPKQRQSQLRKFRQSNAFSRATDRIAGNAFWCQPRNVVDEL
jgi:hypothetical protein